MEGNTSSIHLEVCLNRITLRMVFTLLYLAAWQGRRELVRARVLFFNSYSLVNKTFFFIRWVEYPNPHPGCSSPTVQTGFNPDLDQVCSIGYKAERLFGNVSRGT